MFDKDIYTERNHLVAVLAALYPSVIYEDSVMRDADYRYSWTVCIELPTGQATWHIPEWDLHLFRGIETAHENIWDGHTTEEKYVRVRKLLKLE